MAKKKSTSKRKSAAVNKSEKAKSSRKVTKKPAKKGSKKKAGKKAKSTKKKSAKKKKTATKTKVAKKKKPTKKKKAAKKPTKRGKSTRKKAKQTTPGKKKKASRKSSSKRSVRSSKAKAAKAKSVNLAAQYLSSHKQSAAEAASEFTEEHYQTAREYVPSPPEIRKEFRARRDVLTRQRKQAEKAEKKVRKHIKAGLFGDVTGCGVSLKKENGVVVGPLQYVVQINVKEKIPVHRLRNFNPKRKTRPKKGQEQKIPSDIDGVQVKVVETESYRTVITSGLVKVKSDNVLRDIREHDINLKDTEIVGGIPIVEENEIGRSQPGWGTLGIAFSNRLDESSVTTKYYAVANAHFAPEDNDIFQPDVDPADNSRWQIGTVKSNMEDADDEGYYVDAALINLNENRQVISRLVHEFGEQKFLFAGRPLFRGLDDLIQVLKFGARTAKKLSGTVMDPEYTEFNEGKVIWATGDEVGFTKQGDSGSALVAPIFDSEGREKMARFLVVGLCFGGDKNNSRQLYASHFSQVIAALKLKIPASIIREEWSYDLP